MSVRSVTEIWSGASAGEGWAVRAFDVQTTTPTDGPVVALLGDGIPRKSDSHPDNPWLNCLGPEVSEVKGPCSFIVTARYERTPYAAFALESNPLEEPWKVSGDCVSETWPVDHDADGEPLQNAALETFDPPLQEEFLYASRTLSKNRSAALDDAFQGSVNADKAMGCPPGQLRMKFRWEKVIAGRFTYYPHTFTIVRKIPPSFWDNKFSPWDRRELNRGFRHAASKAEATDMQLALAGGNIYFPNRGADGELLTEPQLLAKDGTLLAKGAKPVWLYFKRVTKLPWARIGFPG